ncbi:DUF4232 domain-containing protein [Streptomyces sp. NPDC052225]|uniref:DUF4232 domain-containing protein n=1 Tax=Streptomyces sp. NPDC052225 TaxID=3154949 RepID=UPI003426D075
MALAGTALLALSACGGGPSRSAAPHASPVGHAVQQQAAGRCTAAHLRPAVAGSEGAAGSVYYDLTLTNTGSAACVLKGYPGVSLIQRDGSTVGAPATREGGKGAPVTLAPGRAAHTTLHTLNEGVSDAGCWRGHDLIKIYPPGSYDPLTLRDSHVRVCGGRFTVTAMTVSRA